jgi:hypothetical protein
MKKNLIAAKMYLLNFTKPAAEQIWLLPAAAYAAMSYYASIQVSNRPWFTGCSCASAHRHEWLPGRRVCTGSQTFHLLLWCADIGTDAACHFDLRTNSSKHVSSYTWQRHHM